MSKTYVIRWKSTVNGRAGKGTKCFEREEAERLAEELNREYPQIIHEAVEEKNCYPHPTEPQPEPVESQDEPGTQQDSPAPVHAHSFDGTSSTEDEAAVEMGLPGLKARVGGPGQTIPAQLKAAQPMRLQG